MDRDPQRLLVTSDLHFGLYPAGDNCTHQLAEYVCTSDADAFAIAGDVADVGRDNFAACLELFADFPGTKLLVPGNHDLWVTGANSETKYREVLPALAAERGFHMLDTGPVRMGGVGIIGSIGWYDYTFRSPDLSIPLEQYRRKRLPGVCTWNDGRFITWKLTDEEFTDQCVRSMDAAYRSVEPEVDTVLAVLHALPFRSLMHGPSSTAYEFCRAFLGSERLGELLKGFPKLRYVFCGHRHAPEQVRVNGVRALVVGSEYLRKRLLSIDLTTGIHSTELFEPLTPARRKTDFLPGEDD
ncbi:MAG: hypothetical protein GXY85_12210 [Candidatus Brocadiaceae bacterium]|nr:hypothetical protein [Candidatus Brocadiaceae bacterium]